jgi:hypothetical protein
MKTYVETQKGERVEIEFGTLICLNRTWNYQTIADWLSHQEFIEVKIVNQPLNGQSHISVSFPDSAPVSTVESLLEHFEYQ